MNLSLYVPDFQPNTRNSKGHMVRSVLNVELAYYSGQEQYQPNTISEKVSRVKHLIMDKPESFDVLINSDNYLIQNNVETLELPVYFNTATPTVKNISSSIFHKLTNLTITAQSNIDTLFLYCGNNNNLPNPIGMKTLSIDVSKLSSLVINSPIKHFRVNACGADKIKKLVSSGAFIINIDQLENHSVNIAHIGLINNDLFQTKAQAFQDKTNSEASHILSHTATAQLPDETLRHIHSFNSFTERPNSKKKRNDRVNPLNYFTSVNVSRNLLSTMKKSKFKNKFKRKSKISKTQQIIINGNVKRQAQFTKNRRMTIGGKKTRCKK